MIETSVDSIHHSRDFSDVTNDELCRVIVCLEELKQECLNLINYDYMVEK